MPHELTKELLTAVWPLRSGHRFATADGRGVWVAGCGEYDAATDSFRHARVEYDGEVYHGDVVISAGKKSPSCDTRGVVLHIVPSLSEPLLAQDGEVIPQVVVEIPQDLLAFYRAMKAGAGTCACSQELLRMRDVERAGIIHGLLCQRLERKFAEIESTWREYDKSWNETMYIQLVSYMGHKNNNAPFRELARKVPFGILLRERSEPLNLEALLLGTSGLLEMYDDDRYILRLRNEYEHLRSKYSITPMLPLQWKVRNMRAANHPALRIVQLAAFFCTNDFLFDKMMDSRTVDDVRRFYRAQASDYWTTHFSPSKESGERTKQIGQFTANMLGINVTVPMLFAYGKISGDENLQKAALELLDKLALEDIKIVNDWRRTGIPMESAFDSQAFLELNNEYCARGRCWCCPCGRRTIRARYLAQS